MKINRLAAAVAGAVMLLAGLTSGARAALITQNYTLSATPDSSDTVIVGGNPGGRRIWVVTGQTTPFNLSVGDILQVNVAFTSPVSLQDTGSPFFGNAESISVSFNNGLSSPGFAASWNGPLTLSGISGSYPGIPPTIFGSSTAPVEGIGLGVTTNFTNSLVSFTGFSLSATVTAIPPQTAPFSFANVILLDDVLPAASVPVPGALALLGLGLFGIGGLRRKKLAH